MLPSKLKPFFLISKFLKALQMFRPNPLRSLLILHEEILLLSFLNISVSSTVDFL